MLISSYVLRGWQSSLRRFGVGVPLLLLFGCLGCVHRLDSAPRDSGPPERAQRDAAGSDLSSTDAGRDAVVDQAVADQAVADQATDVVSPPRRCGGAASCVWTLAGTGVPGQPAEDAGTALLSAFDSPQGVALRRTEDRVQLFVVDRDNSALRRIDRRFDGFDSVITLTDALQVPFGVALGAATIYVADKSAKLFELTGFDFTDYVGSPPKLPAVVDEPCGLQFVSGAAASAEQLYVAELGGRVLRFAPPNAIAGVLAAYLWAYPRQRLHWVLLWFPIKIPVWVFLAVWVAWHIVMGFFASGEGAEGVAWFAHLGGFAVGFAVTPWMLKLRRREVAKRVRVPAAL